jgi:putative transposase
VRGPQPTPVSRTERQRAVLEHVTRRQTSPQQLVRRAHIMLLAATGCNNDQIARRLDLDRGTVRTWRARWLTAAPRLDAAEAAGEPERVLRELVDELLQDAPRSGVPDTFTAEQVVQIVALACEVPPAAERPTSHWTPKELATEAVKRGIVAAISPRTVGRFLKAGRSEAAFEPLLAQSQAGRSRRLRQAGGDGV